MLATTCASAPFMSGGNGVFTTAEFNMYYMATCGSAPTTPYTDTVTMTTRHCRSEHLCNAVRTPAQATTHCMHANGMMQCTGT
jgi:hypothetical protein